MAFVEFYHGFLRYRLSDQLVCSAEQTGTPLPAMWARDVLRGALTSPILATQFRSAFPALDGGRAAAPIILPASLADRIAELIGQQRLTLLVNPLPGMIVPFAAAPLVAPPVAVTADQLRAIMPGAAANADTYVDALNTAMAAHGIDTMPRRAAFLAQISVESGNLRATVENLNYTAERLMVVWPRRFPTLEDATPYARNPEALANNVYANRVGNGDAASGDGYRFRGRGLMQVTGRSNYRAVGHEADPESLAQPATAADTAAAFWENNDLNGSTATELARPAFNRVSRTVNGGDHGSQERWDAYQRALRALRPAVTGEVGQRPLP